MLGMHVEGFPSELSHQFRRVRLRGENDFPQVLDEPARFHAIGIHINAA
jgi:hypothetical protein